MKIDFRKITGKIKPLHGMNEVPSTNFCYGSAENGMKFMDQAGIPYSRLHDVGGRYGANVFVDIHNVFRNFDADETKEENYDFTFTDELLKMLLAHGVKPFYRLGETIENDHFIKAYRILPPKDYYKWARICEHIVMHYNEGWANGFNMGIEYWEIWNEPDNAATIDKNQMWHGTKEEYYELYAVTANHLKKRFPDIKVGGYSSVGFYAVARKKIDPAANVQLDADWYYVEFFQGFMKYITDEKHRAPLDFFTWHTYSWVRENIMYAEYVRKTLDDYGFPNAQSICAEWHPDLSKRGTAEDVANILSTLLAWQKSSVDMAHYYNARTVSGYGGLCNPLTDKPWKALYAFKSFNELYKRGQEIFTESDDNAVFVGGATDGQSVAVVLVNNGDEQKTIAVHGLDGLENIKTYTTDDECDYVQGELTNNGISLLAWGATVIVGNIKKQ